MCAPLLSFHESRQLLPVLVWPVAAFEALQGRLCLFEGQLNIMNELHSFYPSGEA